MDADRRQLAGLFGSTFSVGVKPNRRFCVTKKRSADGQRRREWSSYRGAEGTDYQDDSNNNGEIKIRPTMWNKHKRAVHTGASGRSVCARRLSSPPPPASLPPHCRPPHYRPAAAGQRRFSGSGGGEGGGLPPNRFAARESRPLDIRKNAAKRVAIASATVTAGADFDRVAVRYDAIGMRGKRKNA